MKYKLTCATFLWLFLAINVAFFAQDSVQPTGGKTDFTHWQTLGKGVDLMETFAP